MRESLAAEAGEAAGAGSHARLLKELVAGITLTEKQLLKAFGKYGVERFDPVGQKFDPNMHMALFKVPDASKEADTVAVVTKAGYKMHDRIVRPAEVGVVAPPA